MKPIDRPAPITPLAKGVLGLLISLGAISSASWCVFWLAHACGFPQHHIAEQYLSDARLRPFFLVGAIGASILSPIVALSALGIWLRRGRAKGVLSMCLIASAMGAVYDFWFRLSTAGFLRPRTRLESTLYSEPLYTVLSIVALLMLLGLIAGTWWIVCRPGRSK